MKRSSTFTAGSADKSHNNNNNKNEEKQPHSTDPHCNGLTFRAANASIIAGTLIDRLSKFINIPFPSQCGFNAVCPHLAWLADFRLTPLAANELMLLLLPLLPLTHPTGPRFYHGSVSRHICHSRSCPITNDRLRIDRLHRHRATLWLSKERMERKRDIPHLIHYDNCSEWFRDSSGDEAVSVE